MAAGREEWVVEGYRFASMEDADLARLEQEKIKALESRMDYQNSEMVLSVYNRAIMNHAFQTPVGCQYLVKLRNYLLETGAVHEGEIRPIPFQAHFSEKAERAEVSRRRTTEKTEKEHMVPVWSFGVSVAINVILVLLVMVMFMITLYSDNPNILNYKTQIVNEYASWEQELRAREREVSGRERELGITPEYPNRVQETDGQ